MCIFHNKWLVKYTWLKQLHDDSSILKFDMNDLVNNVYIAKTIITNKLKLNCYNGKTFYYTLLL
jgi:hypothetical protein